MMKDDLGLCGFSFWHFTYIPGKILELEFSGSSLVMNSDHLTVRLVASKPTLFEIKKYVWLGRREVISTNLNKIRTENLVSAKIKFEDFEINVGRAQSIDAIRI